VSNPTRAAIRAAHRAVGSDAYSAATGAAFIAALCVAPWSYDASGTLVHRGEPTAKARAPGLLCDLLREIAGNPFRRPEVRPAWLGWNQGTVLRLAEQIYEEGCFDELPILGDALEEAGCHDEELLRHCRAPGEHVRGCWLLDLVLGKG
jgi:hypothetical protein